MSDHTPLPTHARVVIIGGGVIGCSVAYHLGHLGVKDVVLLERAQLTSGTTWHAAGLMVTFGSTSETSTEMRKYTRDLYARLEAETGKSTGFRPVGFIEAAIDADRLEEYRRVAAFNRHLGVDVHEISASEVGALFPLAKTDDILAGFYIKEDGRADPVDVTMALAAGARMQGVRIVENAPVTRVITKDGKVTGVATAHGDVACEVIVNCTGAWARQLGEKNGVAIPLQAAEHYYLLTERIEGVSKSWPVLEDPASYGYFREEGGGLMIGMFEPVCAPWNVGAIPDDFTFGEIQPDWERMGPYLETAMKRVPITMKTGVKKLFCGPESFTPDLLPIVGEAPEVRNYFVAAGLNSIGILTGGGIGRALAHWIVHGRADIDITAINVDRLHPYQSNPEYRRTRSVESLGMVYQCHYPGRQMKSARGAKRSPIHDRLVAARAYFKEVSGWEGADWYAPSGDEPTEPPLSWRWHEQQWFQYWKAEHDAARNAVILMDMSFMSKFTVCGSGAGAFLDWISANHVDGDPGRVTYTQWLNDAGKLEADLTVTKLDDDRFFVVASDTAHRHAEAWVKRHIVAGAQVAVSDVTSGMAQLNIQGPRSREVMQALTTADMSNAAFPFRCAREVDIGFARVLVLRITYLGELGYELYIPAEQAAHVYERIVEAGKSFGLKHAGLKTLASCRREKGYRD
jgi:4-methylaminobutanoate oxidase (formaldehyde-forming)